MKTDYISNDNNNFEDKSDEVNIDKVLSFFSRNKKIIAFSSILFFIFGSIYSLTQKRVWRGQFQIVISDKNKKFGGNITNDPFSRIFGSTQANNLETEVQILKSPSLLLPIYEYKKEKENLKGKIFNVPFNKWLKGSFKIELIKGTKVLSVKYDDVDKNTINEVLNRVSSQFKKYSKRDKVKSINNGINYLNDQIEIYEKKSMNSLIAAKDFSYRNSLGFVPITNSLDNDDYSLESIRFKEVSKIKYIEEQIKLFDQKKSNPKEIIFIIDSIADITNIVDKTSLKALRKKTLDLAISKSTYTANDPKIKKLEREIKEVSELLINQYRGYLIAQKDLSNSKRLSSERPKEVTIEFQKLIEEAKRDYVILQRLQKENRELLLQKAQTNETWELITNPTILDNPVAPSRRKIASFWLITGFLLSCFYSQIMERKKDLIYKSDTLIKEIGTKPVLDLSTFSEANKEEMLQMASKGNLIDFVNSDVILFQVGENKDKNYEILLNKFANIFNSKTVYKSSDLYNIKNKEKIIFLFKLGEITFKEIKEFNYKINLLEKIKINFIIL